jgi:SAM-dependent methyltransferase
MSTGSVFRCLACNGAPLEPRSQGHVCPQCGTTYSTERGVPVLVRDPSAHAAAIERARQVNPAWYEAEQPPELASPWRHHLKKRRLYVEGVLRRELARRGWRKAPRVLDLGCGDGNNLLWLAGFAKGLYGSDFNMVRLARAKTRSPEATLFLADVLDYPVTDGGFDVIFFNHVIEHIPNDTGALATVQRILAPGGLLILGTPNEGAWWWQVAYRRAPETLATTDHVHFYTAETIGAKMREARLNVFEVKHMGWGPPDWQLDGRWRRYKIVDDLFECIGGLVIPRQASSLYLLATK